MPYRIQLQNFEGPLDLLLFLIKKNEVDISDIPVAEITRQYFEYLEVLDFLDIDNASEFILMAATLIRIKAQMLLPRPVLEDDDEGPDPREELVQRLLEYQRFKDVAMDLSDLEVEQRRAFLRGNFADENVSKDAQEDQGKVPEKEVTLYDLMSVFIQVLKRVPPVTHHTVETIPVTMEEQAQMILDHLEKNERILFTDLFESINERIILIVTFVAILDLVKRERLILNQNNPFSEIWIRKS